MRSIKLSLAAASLVCAFSTAALASNADFTLVNKTGYQIDEVYVSAAAAKNWGTDIMGPNAIADGASVDVTFAHGASACMFDIKVVYADKDTAEFGNVNLCQYEKISLSWDGKKTHATGE